MRDRWKSELMPIYAYTAVDASGKQVRATIQGENESLVLARLREQSLICTEIKEAKQKAAGSGSGKIKAKSLVVFSRQFATMIDAGIPILRCLEVLTTTMKDRVLKQTVETIALDVKSGITLHEAMAKHPRVFSRLYVNMIRAAEMGGILDQILDRLAGFLEYEAEVKGKIKGAMMYPVLVFVFSQIMLFALFTFVLPKFKDIFKGMNVELPPVTKFLFAIGDFMSHNWYFLIGAGIGLFFGLKHYTKTPAGRLQKDAFILRIPVVGELVLKMSVARFSRTFGTLLTSGVPMLRSLEIVGETMGNIVLINVIDSARTGIREGTKLSVPLAQSTLFPTMVTTMIDIGEESGRLPDMLVKVGDFYDSEVESTVKGLTSLIEPLLIIFLGGVVGFIAISIMTPMFKLVNSIHN